MASAQSVPPENPRAVAAAYPDPRYFPALLEPWAGTRDLTLAPTTTTP